VQRDTIIQTVERSSLWRRDPTEWTIADPDLVRAQRTGVSREPRVLDQLPVPAIEVKSGGVGNGRAHIRSSICTRRFRVFPLPTW